VYVVDIETNGVYDVSKIWVIVALDTDTGQMYTFIDKDIPKAIELLQDQILIGHNIVKFDYPVLQKFFPGFKAKKIYDTMLLSNLIWNDLMTIDEKLAYTGRLPKKFVNKVSLEAWGYRLGVYKDEYGKRENAWDYFDPAMVPYCQQDVRVAHALWEKILQYKKQLKPEVVELEHKVAAIIARQEWHGVGFDKKKALLLQQELLDRKQELLVELQKAFPPEIEEVNGRQKLIPFNPNSNKMVAKRLQELGWKPKVFTATGQPRITYGVLESIDLPEAKLLLEYIVVNKRLAQLATGNQALLKFVGPDDRIHGGVLTAGAVSHRMRHFNPNLAQVPAVGASWGKEFRELSIAGSGKKLVGVDASSLELRLLAHYLAPFDKGEYARRVVSDDMHQYHADILGITRKQAKRFIYAFMYGASANLLAEIVGVSAKEGQELKKRFIEAIPGFKNLMRTLYNVAKTGFVKGLDERLLRIRKEHAALNLLIQSAGAIIMKQGLVMLDERLQQHGLVPGRDYEFVLNIHDEWQIECAEEHAEFIGKEAVQAIKDAGKALGCKVEMDGEYKIGDNWAETH